MPGGLSPGSIINPLIITTMETPKEEPKKEGKDKKDKNFFLDHTQGAELIAKNLEKLENDVVKEAGEEIVGGTAAPVDPFSEAFVQGGWKRSS